MRTAAELTLDFGASLWAFCSAALQRHFKSRAGAPPFFQREQGSRVKKVKGGFDLVAQGGPICGGPGAFRSAAFQAASSRLVSNESEAPSGRPELSPGWEPWELGPNRAKPRRGDTGPFNLPGAPPFFQREQGSRVKKV